MLKHTTAVEKHPNWPSITNYYTKYLTLIRVCEDGDNPGLLHSPLHSLQHSGPGPGPGPELLFVAWIGDDGLQPTASATKEEVTNTLQHW